MITVLFACRVKDNPGSQLGRLFESTLATCTTKELSQLEFILKYDNDDTERHSAEFLASWPFPVKHVVYERGEGRHDIHSFLNYLFTLHDPRSRFCLNLADDFILTRSGWVSEILSGAKYCIWGGGNRPDVELLTPAIEAANFRDVEGFVRDVGEYCPIWSVPVLEAVQNLGWQSSLDIWTVALAIALYQNHGLNIWRNLRTFYRRCDEYRATNKDAHAARYVYCMNEYSCYQRAKNPYWYDLIAQQAKNIWLNYEHDAGR